MTPACRLVADVGGTNTRIALYDPQRDEFRALTTYINREFSSFEAVVHDWLGKLAETPPTTGCIAVAAPPSLDHVAMINMDWSFSCTAIAREFGLSQFDWINDFEGNAYALPHLGDGDRQLLHAGAKSVSNKLAVVGPGTGLGGATVETIAGSYHACACEPGHMGLTPADDLELELFRQLLPRFGNIYAELLVSGPGLQRLYEALAQLQGKRADASSPAEISERALRGEDELCVEALDRFCGLLGSVCGDFVLATGSYGGLYLAGGIIPRMVKFLGRSEFQRRFIDKGSMRGHLDAVPIYAITNPQPGLIGAAHAPLT